VKELRFSLTTPENSEQDIQDDGNDKSAKERLGTAAPAPKPELGGVGEDANAPCKEKERFTSSILSFRRRPPFFVGKHSREAKLGI
jgi:hypothetical protein